MNEGSAARDEQRLAFTRRHLGADAPVPERASSDAGFRSYWRTRAPDGTSCILMDAPPDRENVHPWLALRALLETGGVRVPCILAQDAENGWLLMEDLGPDNLLAAINEGNADVWMARAIEQLVRLQRIAPPAGMAHFDEALVRRDLGLFRDWFLVRHLGLALSQVERDLLESVTDLLLALFTASPQVLVHRDFIVRNLMPLEGEVAVLDFQDAVRGPLAYDAASLFRDAFRSWPQHRVDDWLRRYREAALAAGASWLNDVWGLRMDPDMAGLAAQAGCPIVLMHNRSKPKNIAQEKKLGGRFIGVKYDDLITDVKRELQESIDIALKAGVKESQIILDPGIGFGKTVEQSLQLLDQINQFKTMGFPILIGPSRKSFIGYTLDLPPDQRIEGTAATVAIGIDRGADVVRVHDVKAIVRVARMTDAIVRR